ncbi:hypothetical protein Cfor_11102 [Coptotermes formosanus]|uniref:RING-type domain-containing protein n=1 Tax=Coptotermes formosanus TaxID=36987 RepID=A0A6L2QCH3_COPFO|nr:hypothetical protein Cfor_11102 [Coptotermes formosanus]
MEVKDMTAICPICCDDVYPMSCLSAIWAPCCSSKSWFHRDCVQRLALSAGYFFKCPLCNNKTVFQKAMLDFGIYIPEQDASWELEPNAFQELLHRHNRCDAKHCVCPKGRSHAMVGTRWELVLCRYCGSQGIHVGCGNLKWSNPEWECDECTLMLQQAQERGDTDSDEEPDPSPASVNQVPAKRKRRYFKGSGGPRRTKYRKHSMLNSSSHPHPSSSRSPVIPKAIPVIQVTSFAMFDNGQNFSVVGDLDVKLPCHLYDVQQVAQPAASNREMAHISGVMVPGSSVDSSRSSKSLHSSVDGDSSNTSVHSSPAFSHSGQPPASGTARGSLLKSYLTSENVQGGLAYPAEIPTVAPQVDGALIITVTLKAKYRFDAVAMSFTLCTLLLLLLLLLLTVLLLLL